MLIDSVRDCREEDKPAMCHKHGRFHAVTDGTSITTGFMFYFDISQDEATGAGRQRRVLMGPLKGTPGKGCLLSSEHREMINFPDHNNSNSFGVYIRVGSDRQKMSFNAYDRPESQKESKNEDYFYYLPYGIIVNQRIYLFSKAQRRVYYFDLDQISDQIFQTTSGTVSRQFLFNTSVYFTITRLYLQINIVQSRHFNEFFICSPEQKVLDGSGVSKESSQAEYIESASKYVDPAVKETYNFSTLIIVIVIFSSTVIAFGIFLRFYYFRKDNKRRNKRVNFKVAK